MRLMIRLDGPPDAHRTLQEIEDNIVDAFRGKARVTASGSGWHTTHIELLVKKGAMTRATACRRISGAIRRLKLRSPFEVTPIGSPRRSAP